MPGTGRAMIMCPHCGAQLHVFVRAGKRVAYCNACGRAFDADSFAEISWEDGP